MEYNYSYEKSKGGRGEIGFRRYLGRNKDYPNSWYVSTGYQYKKYRFNDFQKQRFLGGYEATVDITWKENELVFGFGKQFYFSKNGFFSHLCCEATLSYYRQWATGTYSYKDHIDSFYIGTTDYWEIGDNYLYLTVNLGYHFRIIENLNKTKK